MIRFWLLDTVENTSLASQGLHAEVKGAGNCQAGAVP